VLAHLRRRSGRREAVLLLQAVVEAALGIDGDERRYAAGRLEVGDEIAQLLTRLDVAQAAGAFSEAPDSDRRSMGET